MRIELTLAAIGMSLCVVSGQVNGGDLPSAVEIGSSAVSTAPVLARGLDGLYHGNRLIAQALYNAQKSTAIAGHQPWSLDSIAVARAAGRNWGEVFQQLKGDGLVEAETLGQVVTWYQYHNMAPIRTVQKPSPAVVKVVTQPTPAN